MNQEIQSMSAVINEQNVPGKLAILFMSEKGGVGKSTLAVSCVEYLRYLKGYPTLVVDADVNVRGVVSRYGKYDDQGRLLNNEYQLDDGVVHLESSTQIGFKPIMQSLKHQSANYAVIDFGAAEIDAFLACFPDEESLALQFRRRGYEVIVVIPFDDQAGQAESVGNVIGCLGRSVNYLLALVPKSMDTFNMLKRQYDEIIREHGHEVFRTSSAYMNGDLRTFLANHTDIKLHDVPEFALKSGEAQSIFDDNGEDGVDEWARHYMQQMHGMWDKFFEDFAKYKKKQLSLSLPNASPEITESAKSSAKGDSK